MTQATIRKGRRMSTAYCYLDPARGRSNLHIQANALTECLVFDWQALYRRALQSWWSSA